MYWFSILKQGRFRYMEFPKNERLERINRDFPIQQAYDSYTLKNNIWAEVGGDNFRPGDPPPQMQQGRNVNMPSIPLFEYKLGRYLTQDDFTLHSRNFLPSILQGYDINHEEVLLDRLGGEDGQKQMMRRYLEEVNLFEENEGTMMFTDSTGRERPLLAGITSNLGDEPYRSQQVTAEINRFLEG